MKPTVKANRILKQNIDALLRRDHLNRKDLAQACGNKESWISKIYRDPTEKREIPLKYLGRIADLFGVEVYELFQPGRWTTQSDRRSGFDRRTGQERRVGHKMRELGALRAELEAAQAPVGGKGKPDAALSREAAAVQSLAAELMRRFRALAADPDLGRQTLRTRTKKPPTPARPGPPRRSTPDGIDRP